MAEDSSTSDGSQVPRPVPPLPPSPPVTPVPAAVRPEHPPARTRPPGVLRTSRRRFLAHTALAAAVAGLATRARPTGAPPDRVLLPGVNAPGGRTAHGGHGGADPVTGVYRPPPDDGRALLQLRPFTDPLPRMPVLTAAPGTDGVARLTVRQRTAQVRLHSALPGTPMWTYEGGFPGPTIEARRGVPLEIAWTNELTGPYPVKAVEVLDNRGDLREWDLPGARGAQPLPAAAVLPPWTVVHLHGAVVGGGADGWPENAVAPTGVQLTRYTNDQPAAALWYHDHAMHVTRLTTMAGLGGGFYLLRDDEEDAAGLPSGEHEIPLVICDRNLDTDPTGRLTGELLYKIVLYDGQAERLPRSFTGPFTLVNGTIWPYLEVDPVPYRLRVLNASSIRPYHLMLIDEDEQVLPEGVAHHVGSDAGLLPRAAPGAEEFAVVPAERADVVIDFSGYAGRTLRWVDGSVAPAPSDDVMQFRVRDRPAGPAPAATVVRAGTELAPGFTRITADVAAPITDRIVLITPAFPVSARMWEMTETDDVPDALADGPVDGIVQLVDHDGALRTFRRAAATWADPVTVHARTEGWERWTWLNLEGPGAPHPMHVHAFTFQVQRRDHYDVSGWTYLVRPDGSFGGGTTRPLGFDRAGTVTAPETGAKDVVSLGGGQLVTAIGRFGPHAGRFVHHCHVYEHEDHRMMRPISLLPDGVVALAPPEHA